MKITINGKIHELDSSQHLSSVIKGCGAKPEHIIAELNGKIIKQDQWDAVSIADGDQLELVTFVGGG
ncbi:MAG: sulfur carrier protein ThiS [Candidatus Omnitrophica bacterium]|nr:sulfur carrier protein ThiS [Candidatus Omnitrophota bacterium]